MNEALRQEVRFLTTRLGAMVQEQCGTNTFQVIENLRQLAKQIRQNPNSKLLGIKEALWLADEVRERPVTPQIESENARFFLERAIYATPTSTPLTSCEPASSKSGAAHPTGSPTCFTFYRLLFGVLPLV
jgi:hypothetical protein